MASEQAKQLRQQGIAAAKAGDKDSARKLLLQSVKLDPKSEPAWTWLLNVVSDPKERMTVLYKLLELNPDSELGLRALNAMGLSTLDDLRTALKAGAAPAAARPSAPGAGAAAETPPAAAPAQPRTAPGVPVANPQRLAEIDSQLDTIVAQFFTEIELPDIVWQQKTRRRAGDQDALRLRIAVVSASVTAFVVLAGFVVLILVNTPEGRAVLFPPTQTPTLTPTVTPTNTPGATPTPSRTPEITSTPSPTIAPSVTPGIPDRNFPPDPTSVFPELPDRSVLEGLILINEAEPATAVPVLATARAQLSSVYDPSLYYYEALALALQGEFDEAEALMTEAEEQLLDTSVVSENDRPRFSPLVDTGFAQIALLRAQAANAQNSLGRAADSLAEVLTRTENAITINPRFVTPYVLRARAYTLREEYDEALAVLADAQLLPELANDTNILLERGEIYYQMGEYETASYWAYYTLYVNPWLPQAYDLQIRTSIQRGDPGLGVIYTQQFLYYYPGSVDGYRLLGDARVAEGNADLALAAYTQALQGDSTDPAYIPALLSLAALFEEQGRYADALSLYDRASELHDSAEIQGRRLRAAYNSGNLGLAEDIANALLDTDDSIVPESELNLILARVLIDRAPASDRDTFTEALTLLETAEARGLEPALRPIADEYRAIVQYRLEEYEDALTAVNQALDAGESGSRHLLRAQILEALQRYDEAARDYEWVLTWSSIYPYTFAEEAGVSLERVRAAALIEPTDEP